MSRQPANQALLESSFLYGANAGYLDDLYARWSENPAKVDEAWREFFGRLADAPGDVARNAEGASWERRDWPPRPNGELVSAFDGSLGAAEAAMGERLVAEARKNGHDVSAAEVQQATRDSIRALMMIRAYRMRGHLEADLDPLRLEPPQPHPELDPASYGFGEEDLDRK